MPADEDDNDDKELVEVDWSSTTIVEEKKDETDEIDTNLEDHEIINKKPD